MEEKDVKEKKKGLLSTIFLLSKIKTVQSFGSVGRKIIIGLYWFILTFAFFLVLAFLIQKPPDNSYVSDSRRSNSKSYAVRDTSSYGDVLTQVLFEEERNKQAMPQTRYKVIIDSLETVIDSLQADKATLKDTLKNSNLGLFAIYKQIDSILVQLPKFGLMLNKKGILSKIVKPKKVVAKRKSKQKKSAEYQPYNFSASSQGSVSEPKKDVFATDKYIDVKLKVTDFESDKLVANPTRGFNYPGKGYVSRTDDIFGYFVDGPDKNRVYIHFDQSVKFAIDGVAVDEFNKQEGVNLYSQKRDESNFWGKLGATLSASASSVNRYS